MAQTIPLNQIVSITPGVIGAGGTAAGTNGVMLTKNPRVPIGSLLSFPSAAAVAAYFGIAAPETNFANAYFTSFSNYKFKSPSALFCAQYPAGPIAAFTRGATISATLPLAALQALPTSTLTLSVDGSIRTTAAFNLSGATSYSGAAALIQSALDATEPTQCSFTGAISGSLLTVSAVTSGTLQLGQQIGGTGVSSPTYITALGTGSGGVGTYTVSASQTLASEAMTASDVPVAASYDSISNAFVLTSGISGPNSAIGFASSTTNFTGAISGLVLTVSAIASGLLTLGQTINGVGVTAGTILGSQISGTAGGVGTYNVSASQAVGNEAMTGTGGGFAQSLGLTAGAGAVISQGAAAGTPAGVMAGVVAITQNFVTFGTVFEPVLSDKLAFAAWANTAQGAAGTDQYCYVMWDSDINATISGSLASAGAQIMASNSNGTIPLYSPAVTLAGTPGNGAPVAAFVMGWAASLDITRTRGRTTLAFRIAPGLVADVVDAVTPQALLANGYNYLGVYGSAGQNFTFLNNGQITGQFSFADSYVGQIILNDALQQALIQLLLNVGEIPYNAEGYALVEAAALDPINAAVNFGTIQPNVPLSSAQIAEVNELAALTIDATLSSRGWYLQINPASAQTRGLRQSPPITLFYMDGGSIQQLNLASIAVF